MELVHSHTCEQEIVSECPALYWRFLQNQPDRMSQEEMHVRLAYSVTPRPPRFADSARKNGRQQEYSMPRMERYDYVGTSYCEKLTLSKK